MKITDISVDGWSTGRIQIRLEGGDFISMVLTEDESERFRQLASDIFFARQKSIAKEIETARPQLIELKAAPVEEAPAPDVDIPF